MSVKRQNKYQKQKNQLGQIIEPLLRSNTEKLNFSKFSNQGVEEVFSNINHTSDRGILLIREIERITDILKRVVRCFAGQHNPNIVLQ